MESNDNTITNNVFSLSSYILGMNIQFYGSNTQGKCIYNRKPDEN